MGVLDKLKQLIEEAKKQRFSTADFMQFEHPLAQQTDWFPLNSGGTNFQTHQLDQSDGDLLVFKATTGAKVFAGIFTGVGVLGIVIPLMVFAHNDFQDWGMLLFAVFFGGIFLTAGLLLRHFMTMPRVFDTFYGCYYKGRKKPDHTMGMSSEQKHAVTHLNEVKAIQLIRERVSSKNGSYHSFELNLVMQDASRINVIDHGNHTAMVADAQTLATTLGVPLWDAT